MGETHQVLTFLLPSLVSFAGGPWDGGIGPATRGRLIARRWKGGKGRDAQGVGALVTRCGRRYRSP
jgi:hypothetical protein